MQYIVAAYHRLSPAFYREEDARSDHLLDALCGFPYEFSYEKN